MRVIKYHGLPLNDRIAVEIILDPARRNVVGGTGDEIVIDVTDEPCLDLGREAVAMTAGE
jgi:hypothetical protein